MSETINKLWVIIPTYNRSDDLIECLESLSLSGIKKEHIIVVDNCSQDETRDKVRNYHPEIILISLEKNLGATGASNIGFQYALNRQADYILRLDSDTIVSENFIRPMLNVAESDPKIGIISPKIYYFEPPDEIWYAGADAQPLIFGATNEHRHEIDRPQNSYLREVDYVWAAAMLIKSEVIKKTGGFDTDFFVYYEEVDFCERVRKLGYKLMFVPDSTVWHKVGSSANNKWTATQWNRSKMILYRKHAKNYFHLLFLIFYAFIYAFADSIFNKLGLRKKSGNRGPLKYALKGLWDGLSYLI
jgi:GT2 family glycosyltransferase